MTNLGWQRRCEKWTLFCDIFGSCETIVSFAVVIWLIALQLLLDNSCEGD